MLSDDIDDDEEESDDNGCDETRELLRELQEGDRTTYMLQKKAEKLRIHLLIICHPYTKSDIFHGADFDGFSFLMLDTYILND